METCIESIIGNEFDHLFNFSPEGEKFYKAEKIVNELFLFYPLRTVVCTLYVRIQIYKSRIDSYRGELSEAKQILM